MSNIPKDIFLRSAEIIVNSAKSLILSEWDDKIISISDQDKPDEIHFLEYSSEFLIAENLDGKIFMSANRDTIQKLAMDLYCIDLFDEDENMLQDSLNELLNYFIGNAARELEKLGLDFIESLIPTKIHFEEKRNEYENYKVIIPTSEGEIMFVFSTKF